MKAIPLSTFNSANLLNTFQVINSAGLPFPCFLVRIVNAATTAITISYDGITDNEYLAANTAFDLPLQTNAQPNNKVCLIPAFTKIYVRGTAGAGTIALSGYYV